MSQWTAKMSKWSSKGTKLRTFDFYQIISSIMSMHMRWDLFTISQIKDKHVNHSFDTIYCLLFFITAFFKLGSLAIYVYITCLIFSIINRSTALNLNKQFLTHSVSSASSDGKFIFFTHCLKHLNRMKSTFCAPWSLFRQLKFSNNSIKVDLDCGPSIHFFDYYLFII